MKFIKLFTVIAAFLLMTSVFTVIPAFSSQPPVDTTTYYVGTVGQPARLDPGRAYDTASGELIQNVYQPLIWFGSKNVINPPSGGDVNLTQADHADLTYPSGYTPVIAKALPTITPSGIGTGQYWNFPINTNAQFQKWTGPDGVINGQPKRNVTVDDVVYSFQVQMVFDSLFAPVWMFESAAFNIMTFDALWPTGFNVSDPAEEARVGNMIQQWCHPDPAHPTTNVIFNFTNPLPQSAMAQIFAQPWGSIVNKDFYIAHGSWKYSFAPGWAGTYRRQPDGFGGRTPIDRYYAATSLYNTSVPNVGTDVPDMCGTGPYKYEFGGWNQTTETWRLDRDPTYWKGWANAGDKAGNYFSTIIERGIATWPTRKMLFLTGEFDVAVVPRANMFDLLVGTNMYQPLPGLTLVTNITSLANEGVFFNFNVSGASSNQSYVGYPTHLVTEPYFFNNTAMRLAFAYALNYTQVIQQGWFGEAVQQASWWVDGLVPASSKNLTLTANMRNIDITLMKYYLSQAIIAGYNISQVGFETTAFYLTGNDQRMIELQSIANAFAQAGLNYKVNVVGLDWPTFSSDMYSMQMPVFCTDWLADYADPSDWASPYQQSTGSFLYFQGPPWPGGDAHQAAIDAEIAAAAIETNATLRDQMYQDLQYKYWLDLPSIPVVQPVGRRYAHDWVKGWYYNDLLPGLYAYDLYKVQQVNVHKFYSQEPAPMGIADYGIGPSGPYEYATNDSVGIVTIASLSTYGSFNDSAVNDTAMSFQLNVNLVFNTSYGQYVYWIQNCVMIDTSSNWVDFANNVWNFTGHRANMTASGVYGNGQVYSGNQAFYAFDCLLATQPLPGNNITLKYPTTIKLGVTARVSSSGEPNVSFAYDDGYGLITYDTVTFTNVTGLTSLTGFEVNGFDLTPRGSFYNSELILGGPCSAYNTTNLQSDVRLQLEYWNGHNYQIVPNAFNFGETGEGINNTPSQFSYDQKDGTINAKIQPGAGQQLGELYDQSQIGTFDITSPLTSGTLYVTNVSDPNARRQIQFVGGEVTVTLYPGYYFLQLYNQAGQRFDQGNFTVSAGQILYLQTPFGALIIPGDANHDGRVNILDAILVSNAFLARPGSSNWNPNADIDGNGWVNILDAIILSNNWTG